MSYRFAFSRKGLLGITAGFCVLAVLIFVSGFTMGVGLWMPTLDEIALLKRTKAPSLQTLQTKAALAPLAPEKPSPAPVAPVAASAIPPASEATPAVPAPAAAAPVAALTTPPPSAPAAEAAAGGETYVLQVGAFRKPENAKQLQTELKERGYPAMIFKTIDGERRVWHAVRLYGFPTMSTAARAASDFTNKEQIQALVRPSDTL